MNKSPFDQTIVSYLSVLSQFNQVRQPILEALNITSPCMAILSGLYRHGATSRTKLAQTLGLGTNALGRPLDQLVKANLIKRSQSSDNRRYINLTLTSTGTEVAKQYRNHMRKAWRFAFKNLPDQQVEQFTETLDEIARQLSMYNEQLKQ